MELFYSDKRSKGIEEELLKDILIEFLIYEKYSKQINEGLIEGSSEGLIEGSSEDEENNTLENIKRILYKLWRS